MKQISQVGLMFMRGILPRLLQPGEFERRYVVSCPSRLTTPTVIQL